MAFQSNRTRFAASCLALLACMPASATTTDELLRLTEQLDQMDFDQAIDKANKCIQARDFSCSEAQLKAAGKLATASAAKDQPRRTEALQLAEKEAVEVERQALARRQRELEEEELRLQVAEEHAARQAASAEEEEFGTSAAQGAALFGSLLAQAYEGQAAARMAEAAQGRRIRQQLEASRTDVARNQQRFAEERVRIEVQRARLLQQQQQQQQQHPQLVRQQALVQREQEAAAVPRAQLAQAQRQEVDASARATVQAEAPSRSAQTLVAAANARTSTGNTPVGRSSGSGSANVVHDSRIKRHGRVYVVHYAALKHSRSDKENLTLIGRITPVSWTYDVPRVSQQQEASGRSDTVPWQVSDLLLKQMRPKFLDYLHDRYTSCSESGPKPDGCYVSTKYHQIGNSVAEVQAKLDAMLPSFSAPVTNDSGLNYPPSIAYSE